MMKIGICLLFGTLMALVPVLGASLEGTVYDYALVRVDQAVVEISTDPMQRQVAVGGVYHFDVPPGNYTLRAQELHKSAVVANASQPVTMVGDGRFTLDIVLSPVLDVGEDAEKELDVESLLGNNTIAVSPSAPSRLWIEGVIIMMGVASLLVWIMRKARGKGLLAKARPDETKIAAALHPSQHVEMQDAGGNGSPRPDLALLVRTLKAKDGRATQREIRKELPFSESKVSLMLAELESEGKIKKIKKGRGNIIILQG